MALAEKFLFDFSFDAPGGDPRQRGAVTPAEPVFSRAELAYRRRVYGWTVSTVQMTGGIQLAL